MHRRQVQSTPPPRLSLRGSCLDWRLIPGLVFDSGGGGATLSLGQILFACRRFRGLHCHRLRPKKGHLGHDSVLGFSLFAFDRGLGVGHARGAVLLHLVVAVRDDGHERADRGGRFARHGLDIVLPDERHADGHQGDQRRGKRHQPDLGVGLRFHTTIVPHSDGWMPSAGARALRGSRARVCAGFGGKTRFWIRSLHRFRRFVWPNARRVTDTRDGCDGSRHGSRLAHRGTPGVSTKPKGQVVLTRGVPRCARRAGPRPALANATSHRRNLRNLRIRSFSRAAKPTRGRHPARVPRCQAQGTPCLSARRQKRPMAGLPRLIKGTRRAGSVLAAAGASGGPRLRLLRQDK